jgi:hypothetical protein
VKCGGVNSSSFLGGFRVWVWDSQFGLVLKKSSWFVWPAPGERLLPDSSWGLRRRPGYVEKVKLVCRWVVLNSLFRFCIWHSGRLPSLICDVSKSWCGGRIRRGASSFSYGGLVLYLFSCVQSSLCALFWETFGVHHSNCYVLLWPVSTDIVL